MGILDTAKEATGIESFNMGAVGTVMIWFAVIIILAIVTAVLSYLYVMNKKFNKKIVIFARVNGVFQDVAKDRARVIKVGRGGDTAFLWKKAKAVRPTPSLQTGINTYWYFLRADGEYINFCPGDLDQMMRELGANFSDKELRYAKAGLQKLLKDAYDKTGFWEKYGGVMAFGILILLLGVAMWLNAAQTIKINAGLAGITKDLSLVVEEVGRLLSAMDNICGTGLVG